MTFIRLIATVLTLSLLIGCATTSPHTTPETTVPNLSLQPPLRILAAEYVTHRDKLQSHQHQSGAIDAHRIKEQVRWHFIREENRLEIENLSANTGEIWLKDGKDLFMYKVFHADKHSIEYRGDDFSVLKMSPKWDQQALLIDPALFTQLQEVSSEWQNGAPIRHYKGKIKDQTIELDWRVDLNIPARIKRESPDLSEETQLVSASDLKSMQWTRKDSSQYQVTDYSDIGDMERDPFIIKIQSQLPGGDVHHH